MNLDKIGPVRLGGFAIDVVDNSEQLRDRGLMGFMSTLDMRLEVRVDDTSDQVAAQTLVHEALHAIDEVYLEGDHLSEAQVMSISHGLFQLIVDNPGFIRAIWEATNQCESE